MGSCECQKLPFVSRRPENCQSALKGVRIMASISVPGLCMCSRFRPFSVLGPCSCAALSSSPHIQTPSGVHPFCLDSPSHPGTNLQHGLQLWSSVFHLTHLFWLLDFVLREAPCVDSCLASCWAGCLLSDSKVMKFFSLPFGPNT